MKEHRNENMPMHYRNIDRHGIGNMQAEKVKIFDRLKFPVVLVFVTIGFIVLYIGMDFGIFKKVVI